MSSLAEPRNQSVMSQHDAPGKSEEKVQKAVKINLEHHELKKLATINAKESTDEMLKNYSIVISEAPTSCEPSFSQFDVRCTKTQTHFGAPSEMNKHPHFSLPNL